MIRRLIEADRVACQSAPSPARVQFWLRAGRTPVLLIVLVGSLSIVHVPERMDDFAAAPFPEFFECDAFSVAIEQRDVRSVAMYGWAAVVEGVFGREDAVHAIDHAVPIGVSIKWPCQRGVDMVPGGIEKHQGIRGLVEPRHPDGFHFVAIVERGDQGISEESVVNADPAVPALLLEGSLSRGERGRAHGPTWTSADGGRVGLVVCGVRGLRSENVRRQFLVPGGRR